MNTEHLFCVPRIPDGDGDRYNQAHELIQLCNELFLLQYVAEGTRNMSTLDLIFTNAQELIHCIDLEGTTQSDHRLITVQTNLQLDKPKRSTPPEENNIFKRLNFYQADWDALNQKLSSIDWNTTQFLNVISDTCQQFVPLKKGKSSRKSKSEHERRAKFCRKTKLRKKLKDISDKNSPKRVKIEKEIYEIDKFIKDSFAHDLKMEEEKAIKAIKKNNKFFYSYAKKKSKTKVTIGPFMDNNNKVINDPHTIGDMLKTQYKSVQSKPKSEKIVSDPISFFKTDNGFTLNDINFNQNDVKKAMLEECQPQLPQDLTIFLPYC